MSDSTVDVGSGLVANGLVANGLMAEPGNDGAWRNLWKVHLALILVQVSSGGYFIVNKFALGTGVNPIVFALHRDIVCILFQTPLAYLVDRKKKFPRSPQVLAFIVLLGFLGPFCTQLLLLYGVSLTSAGYASVVSVLIPLCTFITSVSCGFEQIRWGKSDGHKKLLGLLICVVGATILAFYFGPVVFGSSNSGQHNISLLKFDRNGIAIPTLEYITGSWELGITAIFLAAWTSSFALSIQTPIMSEYPAPIAVTAMAYMVGLVWISSFALVVVTDSWVITDRAAIFAYLYNGIVTASGNTILSMWGVKLAGPVLVGSYVPLQLFSSNIMAYFFLGESIHLGSITGALLIILGLGIITWSKLESAMVPNQVRIVPPLDVITGVSPLEEALLS